PLSRFGNVLKKKANEIEELQNEDDSAITLRENKFHLAFPPPLLPCPRVLRQVDSDGAGHDAWVSPPLQG
ncbi:unnamed protein product, partial [Amoebophrya sp. A120]